MGVAVFSRCTGSVDPADVASDRLEAAIESDATGQFPWSDAQAPLAVYCRGHGLPFVPIVVASVDQTTESGDFVPKETVAALAADEPGYARAEAAADLCRIKTSLTKDEWELLRLVYWDGLTQADIARLQGTNRMNVSRRVASTLRKGGEALGLIAA